MYRTLPCPRCNGPLITIPGSASWSGPPPLFVCASDRCMTLDRESDVRTLYVVECTVAEGETVGRVVKKPLYADETA